MQDVRYKFPLETFSLETAVNLDMDTRRFPLKAAHTPGTRAEVVINCEF